MSTITNYEGNFEDIERINRIKKKILEWYNPVEYVNNMYGCHPGEEGMDYFKKVFSEGDDDIN